MTVHYPHARHTLQVATLWATELARETEAMPTILHHISQLTPGQPPQVFGHIAGHLTTDSQRFPRICLALQFVLPTHFYVHDAVAVRLGHSTPRLNKCEEATSSHLIYYYSDHDPVYHTYYSDQVSFKVSEVTCSTRHRIIQCLFTEAGYDYDHYDDDDPIHNTLTPDLTDNTTTAPTELHDRSSAPDSPPRLATIEEENMQDVDAWLTELYDAEPMRDIEIEQPTIVPTTMLPHGCVCFYTADSAEAQLMVRPEAAADGVPDADATVFVASSVEDFADDQPHDVDEDGSGRYIDIELTNDMAPIILDERQYNYYSDYHQHHNYVPALRVYIAKAIKRAVVIKDDDLLTHKEVLQHAQEVAKATRDELDMVVQ